MSRRRRRLAGASAVLALAVPTLTGCAFSGHAAGGGSVTAAAAGRPGTTGGTAGGTGGGTRRTLGGTGTAARPGAAGGIVAKVAAADRTHEVPTPAPAEHVAGGWRTPTEAVAVFATQYINWTSEDVAARLRSLAGVSVGQARSAVTQAGSEAASDPELQQGGVANVGTVKAVAPVQGERHEYAVVTRERTVASGTGAYRGLPPAWHLALATVTQVKGGLWVLSGWTPEN